MLISFYDSFQHTLLRLKKPREVTQRCKTKFANGKQEIQILWLRIKFLLMNCLKARKSMEFEFGRKLSISYTIAILELIHLEGN